MGRQRNPNGSNFGNGAYQGGSHPSFGSLPNQNVGFYGNIPIYPNQQPINYNNPIFPQQNYPEMNNQNIYPPNQSYNNQYAFQNPQPQIYGNPQNLYNPPFQEQIPMNNLYSQSQMNGNLNHRPNPTTQSWPMSKQPDQPLIYPNKHQVQFPKPNLSMKQRIIQEADKIFLQYDANNSGYLDVREIYPAICHIFKIAKINPPSYGDSLSLMKNFDQDGNGLIDMKEFRDLLLIMCGLDPT